MITGWRVVSVKNTVGKMVHENSWAVTAPEDDQVRLVLKRTVEHPGDFTLEICDGTNARALSLGEARAKYKK